MVFHIEQEDYNIATNSNLDIECADGLWNFNLAEGTNTPNDREDDILAKNTTSRINGFDERDAITITVAPITYNDYYCLTPSSCGSTCTQNHGRRYYKDAYLGDRDDFFRDDGARVFSSWSNPQLSLASGTNIYKGFEIKNYYSNIREYEISFQSGYNDVLSLSPSKPQNLNYTIVQWAHKLVPRFTWDENLEPDIAGYHFYRTDQGTHTVELSYIPKGQPREYTDLENWLNLPPSEELVYSVKAQDNNGLLSVSSELIYINGTLRKPNPETELKKLQNYYSLAQNYPNPFNPSTEISYSLKEDGIVVIKVFDVLGKEVAVLKNKFETAGSHNINFNAANLPSGIYFYRITAVASTGTSTNTSINSAYSSAHSSATLFSETKKMLLLK